MQSEWEYYEEEVEEEMEEELEEAEPEEVFESESPNNGGEKKDKTSTK